MSAACSLAPGTPDHLSTWLTPPLVGNTWLLLLARARRRPGRGHDEMCRRTELLRRRVPDGRTLPAAVRDAAAAGDASTAPPGLDRRDLRAVSAARTAAEAWLASHDGAGTTPNRRRRRSRYQLVSTDALGRTLQRAKPQAAVALAAARAGASAVDPGSAPGFPSKIPR